MRKYWLVVMAIVCAALTGFVTTPQLNIPLLRKQLIYAIDHKDATDSLYHSLGLIRQPSPLITGYIGALEALKAKHTWNPYFKIKYLNNAEDSFEDAISRDPHSIELRFMRFSVEHNVPGFLGFNKNLVGDKQMLIKQIVLKNYEHTDKELITMAIKFLIDSKQCTAVERITLHKQLAEIN